MLFAGVPSGVVSAVASRFSFSTLRQRVGLCVFVFCLLCAWCGLWCGLLVLDAPCLWGETGMCFRRRVGDALVLVA